MSFAIALGHFADILTLGRDAVTCVLFDRHPFDEKEVTTVHREVDFARAIKQHIEWRNRLVRAIRSTPASIAALGHIDGDSECEVGRWLTGPGRARYGYLPAFHDLIRLHREFHALAVRVIDLSLSGRVFEAEQLMSADMRFVSTELVARLNRFHWIFDR